MKEIDSAAGVAAYLQCSEEYLKKLRIKGEGPLYFKVGQESYVPQVRRGQVDRFANLRIDLRTQARQEIPGVPGRDAQAAHRVRFPCVIPPDTLKI